MKTNSRNDAKAHLTTLCVASYDWHVLLIFSPPHYPSIPRYIKPRYITDISSFSINFTLESIIRALSVGNIKSVDEVIYQQCDIAFYMLYYMLVIVFTTLRSLSLSTRKADINDTKCTRTDIVCTSFDYFTRRSVQMR